VLARAPATFVGDNAAFERWLRKQCRVDDDDLAYKHEHMTESAFVFLRATYFRWASSIERICGDHNCANAPEALSIGDIHVENFGVWRDREGRLVWGVNDFDEAAFMPYVYDLVRLAASAMLAPDKTLSHDVIIGALLEGYEEGLNDPKPVVLERDYASLRPLVTCGENCCVKFWKEIDEAQIAEPPADAEHALTHNLPKRATKYRFIGRQRRGGGSLGKPRFALVATWRGGDLVREAKAAMPSAWAWAHDKRRPRSRSLKLARSASRAPDPFLAERQGYFLRRISPDNRKIEYKADVKPHMRAWRHSRRFQSKRIDR
jgi:hypothetical protein